MKNFSSQFNTHAMDMEDLLAAPLVATSNANASMAKEQLHFLMESCFEKDPTTGNLRTKTITMSISRAALPTTNNKLAKIEHRYAIFELPIITLLPFSSLCVKNFKTRLNLEVTSQIKREEPIRKFGQSRGNKFVLKSSISYNASKKIDSQPNDQKRALVYVEINGGQIPLPNGLKTILNAYTSHINPVQISKE